MDGTEFEKAPGEVIKKTSEISGVAENVSKWDIAMKEGVPQFAGDKLLGGTGKALKKVINAGEKIGEATFGNANEENNYYGEKVKDGESEEEGTRENEMGDTKKTISEVLSDAVSKYGYGRTMQKLSECDVSDSNDPVGDIYYNMGLGTIHEGEEEAKHDVEIANNEHENQEVTSQNQDVERVRAEINNMKEIINEVKGASSKYEELRQGAWAAGMDVFDYAAKAYGVQSLPELFQVLEEQIEQQNEVEAKQEEPQEVTRQDVVAQDNERLNPEITRGNAA